MLHSESLSSACALNMCVHVWGNEKVEDRITATYFHTEAW